MLPPSLMNSSLNTGAASDDARCARQFLCLAFANFVESLAECFVEVFVELECCYWRSRSSSSYPCCSTSSSSANNSSSLPLPFLFVFRPRPRPMFVFRRCWLWRRCGCCPESLLLLLLPLLLLVPA
jgi:hypothetical protein